MGGSEKKKDIFSLFSMDLYSLLALPKFGQWSEKSHDHSQPLEIF
jgi:hypothetical protein